MKISIVVPTLNEAENLAFVLPRLPRLPEVCEVMLVDGRSTDGTVAAARALLPDINVVCQDGSGKGNAIMCAARAAAGDYFLVLDADGSQRPEEIPLYIEKAKEGYDLVKGSRFTKGAGSEEDTWDRKFTTRTAQFIANTLWRTHYTDICYGMFLIGRQTYLDLDIRSQRHDIEWELMAKAKRHRLRVAEVPAFEEKRISGSSHLSYVKDGRLIATAVFREYFRGLLRKK